MSYLDGLAAQMWALHRAGRSIVVPHGTGRITRYLHEAPRRRGLPGELQVTVEIPLTYVRIGNRDTVTITYRVEPGPRFTAVGGGLTTTPTRPPPRTPPAQTPART